MQPRNPFEADWLIRSAEEEAARAERWAAVAQQQAAYQSAMARAHAADAAGLRALWTFETILAPKPADHSVQPVPVMDEPQPRATPEPTVLPTCEFCGKPTRIWQGKPQRFCSWSKTEIGSSCAHRSRERRLANIRREKRLKLISIAIGVASSENDADANAVSVYPEAPKCQHCGKTTRFWRGKPQKFCSPINGKTVSICASAFHNRDSRPRSRSRAARPKHPTKQSAPVRPSGSVLSTASPHAEGHALLASVTQAVPHHLPDDLRKEIISETALLVLEGAELSQAVAQASKSVRKNAAPLRYTKQIDDCFWLAAEAPE